MENEEEAPKKRRYRKRAPTKEAPLGYNRNGVPKVRRTPDQVKKGFEVVKHRAHQRREKPGNYLKYHRIVMAWARKHTGATTVELEMMFFLYDEDIFHKTKFREYSSIMPFDRMMIARLIEKGWLRTWADSTDRRYKLYELTLKAKMLVATIMRKLEGKEKISELAEVNNLMRKTNGSVGVYSIAIKKMNRKIDEKNRQDRHPTRKDWGNGKRKKGEF